MPDATLLHNITSIVTANLITDFCSPVPTVPMVWVNICTPLWFTPTTYLTLYETMYLSINDTYLQHILQSCTLLNHDSDLLATAVRQNSLSAHSVWSRRLRAPICCVYVRFLAVSVVLIRIKYIYNVARTCVRCLMMNSKISFIRNSVTN